MLRWLMVGIGDIRTRRVLPPESSRARAEADWALAAGRPGDSVSPHPHWLKEIAFGRKSIQKSLRDALLVARQYQLLGKAYQMAGQQQQATDALAQRREILEFWKNQPPSRKFVGDLLSGM